VFETKNFGINILCGIDVLVINFISILYIAIDSIYTLDIRYLDIRRLNQLLQQNCHYWLNG
jgi:hypothetical protein